MPSRETVQAFIAHVMSEDHVGAIEAWYAEDAAMQENQGAMEQMMGVRSGLSDVPVAPQHGRIGKLRVLVGIGMNMLTLQRRIREFRTNLFATLGPELIWAMSLFLSLAPGRATPA